MHHYEVHGSLVRANLVEVAGIQGLVAEKEEIEVDESKSGSRTLSKKQEKMPIQSPFACPSSVPWLKEIPRTDLFIKSNIMTILAMDGRRRVMNIEKFVRALAILDASCFECSEKG